jgi:hypothetical protein
MEVLVFDSRWGLGIFLFATVSRTDLGPTHHPIQWVPGAFPWGGSGSGVKLTTQLHLVQRSRMRGTIPALLPYAFMAWCSVKAQGQLYFTLLPCMQGGSQPVHAERCSGANPLGRKKWQVKRYLHRGGTEHQHGISRVQQPSYLS